LDGIVIDVSVPCAALWFVWWRYCEGRNM